MKHFRRYKRWNGILLRHGPLGIKYIGESFFKNVRFPVGEINEDEAIVLKLLDSCTAVTYTNQVFYHYIHRSQSITTSGFSEKKLAWYMHCKNNLFWVQQHHPELTRYAKTRLCRSILWSMREISFSDQSYEKVVSAYNGICGRITMITEGAT